jgi:hypothetical protein
MTVIRAHYVTFVSLIGHLIAKIYILLGGGGAPWVSNHIFVCEAAF